MKKKIIIALLFATSLTQAQVTIDWFNYPGGVGIATDSSNNSYTANWDYNPAGDITVTKRDALGNVLWNAAYNNTDNTKHEVATWVESDYAGNILVSGTIRSGYSNPVNAASILMKYNSAGTLLWRVVYESSFDGSSTRKCLVDANNNIYVLGLGTGPIGQVTKVKKFNSSGISVWNYFDTGGGAPITFKFTPDNNIVLVKRGITGNINTFTKIDLNGNLIWNTAGINSISIGDAAGDAFGNTYIVNGSPSELKKLSSTGSLIWTQANSFSGNKVEVGTDNNPVVGGYPGASYGVVIKKYDASGNLLWQNLDADGPGLSLLALAPMRLDANNAAYVAGSTMSSMGMCKVNSNGTSAWAATTPSGYPVWFDFGTDNNVYVTGGTTAKFNQSGNITVPAAPSNLTVIASGTSTINVSWIDNSTNETGFVLQRSLSSTSGFTTIATLGANVTSYSNTGLSAATTYYYRVQSTNSAGSSAFSNTASATTAAIIIPAAPSSLTTIASGTSIINLSWSDNSTNETAFVLQRSLSSTSGFATIATLGANVTSYSNTGLAASTTYYYRVQSINSAGSSAFSNTATTTTAAITIPTAPSNLVAAAVGCNSITLTWVDNSNNEASFELRRSTSLNGTYSTIATLSANTTTYVNTGLLNGQRYYYKVRASNTAGNSTYSNKANARATCIVTASAIELNAKGTNDLSINGQSVQDIKIFPNPAYGNFINVDLNQFQNENVAIVIFNSIGEMILNKKINEAQNSVKQINVSGLKTGIYILRAEINNQTINKRFIVQH